MNYFERLEIKQSYDVDLERLENQYFALQSRYHPDLVQNLDEKQRYANIAIELNEGYKILKNDYARAVYLLKLEDIDVADTKVNKVPEELLEAIWQISEQLEQTNQLDDLAPLIQSLEAKLDDTIIKLIQSFRDKNYALATIKTMEMKYYQNLITTAKEKKRNAAN